MTDHPEIDPAIADGDHRLTLPGDVRLGFDEIEASGYGYWNLRLGGAIVATVQDLDGWPSEEVAKFRAIQFGEDPHAAAREAAA